jgi:hypothetical protein
LPNSFESPQHIPTLQFAVSAGASKQSAGGSIFGAGVGNSPTRVVSVGIGCDNSTRSIGDDVGEAVGVTDGDAKGRNGDGNSDCKIEGEAVDDASDRDTFGVERDVVVIDDNDAFEDGGDVIGGNVGETKETSVCSCPRIVIDLLFLALRAPVG